MDWIEWGLFGFLIAVYLAASTYERWLWKQTQIKVEEDFKSLPLKLRQWAQEQERKRAKK